MMKIMPIKMIKYLIVILFIIIAVVGIIFYFVLSPEKIEEKEGYIYDKHMNYPKGSLLKNPFEKDL